MLVLVLAAGAFGRAITADGRAPAARLATAAEPGYRWPVRPFDEIHPVRGNFGDPRTVFDGPPTTATVIGGSGSFAFHAGIDIVVEDRAPVYPVRSGVVTHSRGATVFVDSGNGVVHQYWHVDPEVRAGVSVTAHEDVLGHVQRGYGHVHFADLRHGREVNPLARGHLSPYDDRTTPRIGPIELRRPGTGHELLPELVRGRVEVVVSASDEPAPPTRGLWASMPTSPAVVTWRVERARDAAVVVRRRTAFDVRVRVPSSTDFWGFYARGTRQNMATFRRHRYWLQPGVFVFRLGFLDTRELADGIYAVVATAHDIRGNRATTRGIFGIRNRLGWPPQTARR